MQIEKKAQIYFNFVIYCVNYINPIKNKNTVLRHTIVTHTYTHTHTEIISLQ